MASSSDSSVIADMDGIIEHMIDQLQTLKHQVADEYEQRQESLHQAQSKVDEAQDKAQDAAAAAQAAAQAAAAALGALRRA